MLPPEIEPFADAHIQALENLRQELIHHRAANETPSPEDLDRWMDVAKNAQHGFYRFKVCMADEVKQKERYSKYAKEHGYPFS